VCRPSQGIPDPLQPRIAILATGLLLKCPDVALFGLDGWNVCPTPPGPMDVAELDGLPGSHF
jgi:hypothetical protein